MASVASAASTSIFRPLPAPPAYRPLPPYIGTVSPTDRDADGDNDTGTIVDTFA